MLSLLPYRSSTKNKLNLSGERSIHLLIEEIFELFVEPVDDIVQSIGYGGQTSKHGIGKLRTDNLLSTAQWAILIEGILKGQILNGGFSQYVWNYPYLAAETIPFLEEFATEQMVISYGNLTKELSRTIESIPVDLDPFPFAELDELIDRSFESNVSHADIIEFELAYCGDYEGLDTDKATLGNPSLSECWGDTIARNVLDYCLLNMDQLRSS